MGNYFSQSDLLTVVPRNELVRLTDIDDEGTINAATVTAYIEETEADIDGYLARRRDVPVTTSPTPPKLKRMCVRWWFYVAHRYRQSVSEDLERDHERDVEWLEAYAEGEGSLGDEDDPHSPGVGSAKQDAQTRVWDRDKLKGW